MNEELFKDRYKIISLLGQGGMGRVYLAENIKLNTLWCIKEIDKALNSGIDLLAEPNLLKRLNHPALPRVYDIFEDGKYLYIISDYVEGTSLDKLLESDGRIPEATVKGWAVQLCEVLSYLHGFKPGPVIYRDMKPSNIILSADGRLRLIDFGIAREYKQAADSDTVYIGTRGYAAPEQFGRGQTDPTTDIFSLGVTLHHLLSGKSPNEPPFEMKPVRYYEKNVSEGMEFIIEKCTRAAGRERYQSAHELLEDLMRLKASEEKVHSSSDHLQGRLADAGGKAFPFQPGTGFKKLVLAVWDNAEFGCELAYMAAKLSGYRIMLMDLDLLAPRADLILNVSKTPDRIVSDGHFNDSGLNIALDLVGRKMCLPATLEEASVRRGEMKNLFILTGNYKLENYEYYSIECLEELIEKSYQSFDITVLLLNRSIYDAFTVLSLTKSDYNLIPCRADIDYFREFNTSLVFLKEKQKIPLEKNKFIAFEYDPDINLSRSLFPGITGDNFAGIVRYSSRRAKYRNHRLPYARRMEKSVEQDYAALLANWGILPKASIFQKLREAVKLCPS